MGRHILTSPGVLLLSRLKYTSMSSARRKGRHAGKRRSESFRGVRRVTRLRPIIPHPGCAPARFPSLAPLTCKLWIMYDRVTVEGAEERVELHGGAGATLGDRGVKWSSPLERGANARFTGQLTPRHARHESYTRKRVQGIVSRKIIH